MTAATLFEDFGTKKPALDRKISIPIEVVEEEKLDAFENGFQAGWEDALKAQEKVGKDLSKTLLANLQDASFQYHELRSHFRHLMQDLMQSVIDAALPEVARQTLGAQICQTVQKACESALNGSIEVAVHETQKTSVEQYLNGSLSIECSVVEAVAIEPEQALIRFSNAEYKIDTAQVVDDIRRAVNAFFDTQLQD